MVLFCCNSFLQLMNAIQVKSSLLKDQEADLLLNVSDFSGIIEPLRKKGIFKNIIVGEVTTAYNTKYWDLSRDERAKVSRHPEKYLPQLEVPNNYTDIYDSEITPNSKLIYYMLVKKGMHPRFHAFEESFTSYVKNFNSNIRLDSMDHAYYGKDSLHNTFEEVMFYEPDLFDIPLEGIEITKIPKIDYKNQSIKTLYQDVFGTITLPSEPYIFFEEAMFSYGDTINDMDLIENFADIVGKENISVKIHPRSKIDRFTPRGFKVMEVVKIPWEMIYFQDDSLLNMAMVTMSSSSCFNGMLMFNKDRVPSILLYRMKYIGKTYATMRPSLNKFMDRYRAQCNESQTTVFVPRSSEELYEATRYVGGIYLNGRK